MKYSIPIKYRAQRLDGKGLVYGTAWDFGFGMSIMESNGTCRRIDKTTLEKLAGYDWAGDEVYSRVKKCDTTLKK